jgi:hypothetical protein
VTTQDADVNTTVLVSNQSFDVNPVDVEICIDGRVVVQDMFDVQGDQLPQHNWQQYHLRLDKGSHSLVARSEKGQAQLNTTFEVPDVHTVTIAYWFGRRSARSMPQGYFTIECGPGQVSTM